MCFADASRAKRNTSPGAATLLNKAAIREQHGRASLRNISAEESAAYEAAHGRTDAIRLCDLCFRARLVLDAVYCRRDRLTAGMDRQRRASGGQTMKHLSM